MAKILLRHLSGSKANQVEEFSTDSFRELVFGRDHSSMVRFDPDRDDLVGRQHARLVEDLIRPGNFQIIDLNSRNGTFINRQRIFGAAALMPGDVVQFGVGGPEFEFDLTPRPASFVKETRVTDSYPTAVNGKPIPPTREGFATDPSAPSTPLAYSSSSDAMPPRGIGKLTVERMIANVKSEGRRNLWVAASLIGVVAVAALGFAYFRKPTVIHVPQPVPGPSEMMISHDIQKLYGDSTVYIEFSWKLYDLATNKPLYQACLLNSVDSEREALKYPGLPVGVVPVYIDYGDHQIEPILTDWDGNGAFPMIREAGSATGFLVNSEGYILTNRHVATGWDWAYENLQPGLLISGGRISVLRNPPTNWVPSNARSVHWGKFQLPRDLEGTKESGKRLEGKMDYLDITFPRTRLRSTGVPGKASDIADVALIRLNSPTSSRAVELDDEANHVEAGVPIVVLGYPGVSSTSTAEVVLQGPPDSRRDKRTIPDFTTVEGSVSKLPLRPNIEGTVSNSEGDMYQLNIGTLGPGSSGSPVFDKRSRKVVAIIARGNRDGYGVATFAVPIAYALPLLNNKREY